MPCDAYACVKLHCPLQLCPCSDAAGNSCDILTERISELLFVSSPAVQNDAKQHH